MKQLNKWMRNFNFFNTKFAWKIFEIGLFLVTYNKINFLKKYLKKILKNIFKF